MYEEKCDVKLPWKQNFYITTIGSLSNDDSDDKPQKSNRFILAKQQLCTLVHFLAVVRLVPSRYLSVFWGERRLGIRLRRARGLMGREEGEIASDNPIFSHPKKHLISDWV